MHAFDRDRAIVGAAGRIMKTTDGGGSWRQVHYGINSVFGNICFHDDANGIAISQGEKDSADVLLTSDGGESWARMTPRYYARSPINNSLHFLDPVTGWFASSNLNASPPKSATVHRTTDGGLTWGSWDAGSRSVTDIAFLSKIRGYLVDNSQGRVRRSTNGFSWLSTAYPMNGSRTSAVVADTTSHAIWIVTDTSAWYSRDEGSSWTRTTLVPAEAMQCAVFADSVRGWVVSRKGVVQVPARNFFTSGTDLLPAGGMENMILGQAYPNPLTRAGDACFIPFGLRRSAPIKLAVTNSAGKEIAVLIENVYRAGEHVAVWDASSVPPGVYFYTLFSGKQRTTGRVTVLR
jgi:photosystem II stability/assembly factor-like uncharacterized protein